MVKLFRGEDSASQIVIVTRAILQYAVHVLFFRVRDGRVNC